MYKSFRVARSVDRPCTKKRLSRKDCVSASTLHSVRSVFRMSSFLIWVAASSAMETSVGIGPSDIPRGATVDHITAVEGNPAGARRMAARERGHPFQESQLGL